MTRDEAVKKAAANGEYNVRDVVSVEKFVDRLTRLGLLTLDEPKTAKELAIEAITGEYNIVIAEDSLAALTRTGLKVVRA